MGRSPFSFLLILVAGCLPQNSGTEMAADAAAIRQVYASWQQAAAAGNVDAYMQHVDDSVTLLFPGGAPIAGAPAVREIATGMFAAARYHVTLNTPQDLRIARPWAFVRYTGVFTTVPATGDSTVARNRYVDVLRRQPDGSWRVYIHSAQPDAP